TGVGVVDMIISDVGVFTIDRMGVTLIELAPDVTVAEVRARTEAGFTVAEALL
ncbi:MAG: succinyl-CoA--3-ketoacid-CoA transferase, partial [Alphaproteobacteria bacterium]|nr:succinyl-CoA--3-ketoacid-CoA transferase [Alphaproteobacteria bacterium]